MILTYTKLVSLYQSAAVFVVFALLALKYVIDYLLWSRELTNEEWYNYRNIVKADIIGAYYCHNSSHI